MKKDVLIIGGLGFIGYHISQLMSAAYNVSISYRSTAKTYQSEFDLIHLDLAKMDIAAVKSILKEFSFIVFCGGADDRKIPEGDATAFYYRENVVPCLKIVEASLDTKVEKLIILGSYFSYFDRSMAEWKMSKVHPYVKSRKLQQEESILLAKDNIQVSTLEIPYVFGTAPGITPMWKPLFKYIKNMRFIFYTKGGTNITSVETVAKAVLGILETKIYKANWIVGSENVTWKELISMIASTWGKKRTVIGMPKFILKPLTLLAKGFLKLTKKQTGLDPYHFIDVQSSNTFLDMTYSMKELNYEKVDMKQSIKDTVEACRF